MFPQRAGLKYLSARISVMTCAIKGLVETGNRLPWVQRWTGDQFLILLGGLYLVVLYSHRYLDFYALPGNVQGHPEGWWGWFDQGKYIDSARALAVLDFTAARHWYPLGYSIIGAPFIWLSPLHPFMVADLLCLLICYAGFLAFAQRLIIRPLWAVVIFGGSVTSSQAIFAQWIIPWNTSLSSALIWVLLACVAAHLEGRRRPFVIGMLVASLPLIRPIDAVLAVPSAIVALSSDRHHIARDFQLFALGCFLVTLPYIALHSCIYGLRPSEYTLNSAGIGFSAYDLGWKAYTILVDPRAWFLDGEGLIGKAPFMALSLGGLAVTSAYGRAARLLVALLVIHFIVYISYIDLLPVGFWRFNNVHYWKWTMPGLGLLAFLLVRDLLRWRSAPAFPLAPMALISSLPILCLQLVPVSVATDQPAKMLVYRGAPPGFYSSYFAPLLLQDSLGSMHSIANFRAIPSSNGLRVFALTRSFGTDPVLIRGPIGWQSTSPPTRYAIQLRLGIPC
jgi:hypothetical protein